MSIYFEDLPVQGHIEVPDQVNILSASFTLTSNIIARRDRTRLFARNALLIPCSALPSKITCTYGMYSVHL